MSKPRKLIKVPWYQTIYGGLYVVAARNIKAGEVVMREPPLSYGPNDITKPICLGCCAPVTIKSPTCDICGFPMCSKECINSKVHKVLGLSRRENPPWDGCRLKWVGYLR